MAGRISMAALSRLRPVVRRTRCAPPGGGRPAASDARATGWHRAPELAAEPRARQPGVERMPPCRCHRRSSPTPRTGPGCWSGPAPSAGSRPATSRWSGCRRPCSRTPPPGRAWPSPTCTRGPRRRLVGAGVRLPRPRRAPGLRRRVRQLLGEDEPRFANWDQDATAVEDGYAAQDPAVVGARAARRRGRGRRAVRRGPARRLGRRGTRSNGSEFTVETLGRYHLHDVVHHLHDIAPAAPRRFGAPATGPDR